MLIGYHLTNDEKYKRFRETTTGNLHVLVMDCRDNKSVEVDLQDIENVKYHYYDVPLEDRNKIADIVRNTARNSGIPYYCFISSNVTFLENLDFVAGLMSDENVGILYSDFLNVDHKIFHTSPVSINHFPFIVFRTLNVDAEAAANNTSIEDYIAQTYIVKYIPRLVCKVWND